LVQPHAHGESGFLKMKNRHNGIKETGETAKAFGKALGCF
jgi:hypothetical protein